VSREQLGGIREVVAVGGALVPEKGKGKFSGILQFDVHFCGGGRGHGCNGKLTGSRGEGKMAGRRGDGECYSWNGGPWVLMKANWVMVGRIGGMCTAQVGGSFKVGGRSRRQTGYRP